MFEARDQEDILTDLQTDSSTAASKIEGTFEYDMFAANSIEFAKTEVELRQAYNAMFADTSWGEFLTARAAEFGVIRKAATAATGTLTISGTGTVPAGSIFATASGSQYATDVEVTVSGSGTVAATCTATGESGNAGAGTITTVPMSIPGITAVSNASAMTGGYAEETDEELLARYLLKVRTPATSGNKNHYYEWAMSVSGVGACRILPLWNGNGTVKVLIVGEDMKTAPASIVSACANYIETVRPIGATVTVTSPTPVYVDVTVDIAGTCDTEALVTALNTYLKKYSLTRLYLSAAQVGDIIMNQTTVEDYDNLLVNGAVRITCTDDELFCVRGVTVHGLSVPS